MSDLLRCYRRLLGMSAACMGLLMDDGNRDEVVLNNEQLLLDGSFVVAIP